MYVAQTKHVHSVDMSDNFSTSSASTLAVLSDERSGLPPIGDWTNNGYECFREMFGEDFFRNALARQFNDTPSCDTGFRKFKSGCSSISRKLCMAAFFTGKNVTHPYGVLLSGTGKVITTDLADCGFFAPNQTFTVTARHSSAGRNSHDDAAVTIKSLAVSFHCTSDQQRLDLLCNTGRMGLWYNLPTFEEYLSSLSSVRKLAKFVKGQPCRYASYADALRRGPESFNNLYYYNWHAYCLTTKGGQEIQAKFRVIPSSGEMESVERTGLLPPDHQKGMKLINNQQRDENDQRPTDYLRKEIVHRARSGKALYKVQIQIRDSLEYRAFNMSEYWDDREYPWRDLIEFSLDSVVTDFAEYSQTCFNLVHMPACLSFPEPSDELDFRSLAHLRTQVYRKVQKARMRSFKDASSFAYCPVD